MEATQAQVEAHLVRNQKAKEPRLRAALKKLQRKLRDQKENPDPRQAHKVEDWENLCEQYKADIKLCEEGSYHGANGKPFGATPGITG